MMIFQTALQINKYGLSIYNRRLESNLFYQNVYDFEYNFKRFVFYKPYRLEYKILNNSYHFNDIELGVFAFDNSVYDMLDSFYDMFYTLWHLYAEASDNSLTEDAIKVKKHLKKLCKVENVDY